jgi:hypothetical protein
MRQRRRESIKYYPPYTNKAENLLLPLFSKNELQEVK